jgi:glycosyltransferase involved in cell wall biosynthesis
VTPSFKIVIAVWERPDLLERCIASIAAQTLPFIACIADDASEDPGVFRVIRSTLADDNRFIALFQNENVGTLHNQCDAVDDLCDDDDDIIVYVDGDDRLAHPQVLERLAMAYGNPNVQLTYGSYKPDPFSRTDPGCRAYPQPIIDRGDYRAYAALRRGICFNHLRTFKFRLFRHMDPEVDFKIDGEWMRTSSDTATMIPGLELAGPKGHRYIRDVLYLYTSDRPESEWRRWPQDVDRDHRHVFTGIPRKEAL